MSDTIFDPDERFTLEEDPEEVLRRNLEGEGTDKADWEPEPEVEPGEW